MKNWLTIVVSMSMLDACAKQTPDAEAGKPAAAAAAAAEHPGEKGAAPGVELDAADVAALGVRTAELAAAAHLAETAGFAVVASHAPVAQAVADVVTAQAAERQSRSALERLQRLAGTDGAETLETQEAAVRQSAADTAALLLAERKASTVVGQRPPWAQRGPSALRDALASGRAKLVRVTFPLGALPGARPTALRLARLDGVTAEAQWRGQPVWDAPAEPDVPGRSFFTVLENTDLGEGEHLSAWAPVGATAAGVIVPAAAVIADAGRYWCYVERSAGRFVRLAVELDRPTDQGYFVTGEPRPGDKVVIAAAGLLLARELHPGAAAD